MVETVEIVLNGEKVNVAKKALQVKEWFAHKVFKEKTDSNFFDNRIFAIFGESEKAYNCFLGGLSRTCITWVPKSVVEENEDAGEDDTFVVEKYEAAKAILDEQRRFWG